MCGIIGIAGKNAGAGARIERAIEALALRGPDDRGVAHFDGAVLGHTRLAVIDLSETGHQPMRDAKNSNAIVFNGEIYNYKALRLELEQKGHAFSSNSDTEVILKAYAQWGERCPEHLDGQFAFAIWDEKDKKLFLARDRFGEKPLFVARSGDGILFGSEIKALLATNLIRNEVDPVSLDNYLALGYVPPWRSIYKSIAPLKPAHRAVWQDGSYREEPYWRLKREPSQMSFDEAAARIRELLTELVRSRMVADVEVGAFLSGGVDSGIVVRLAQQITGAKIRTFSAGFEDVINELPYAREVAELAGTEHTEAQMHEDTLETFKQVSAYFDEPFADSSNVPTSLISKLARQKVKVALSGDGGDELFWGYGQYTHYRHLPKLQALQNALLRRDAFDHYRKNILTVFPAAEREMLLKDRGTVEADPTVHIDYAEAKTPLDKINLTDFYMGLPGDMLAKVDRSSMMHSLEVRSPFLNHELAQFAYNLPQEFKTDGRRGKIILEKAFGDLLPPGFFARKKQGFGAPIFAWLRRPETRAYLEKIFSDNPRTSRVLDIDRARQYLERLYAGDRSLEYKAWTLLSLEVWMRTHE